MADWTVLDKNAFVTYDVRVVSPNHKVLFGLGLETGVTK